MRTSRGRKGGSTLGQLRDATAAKHASIDALIEISRLTDPRYYSAVIRGLIESAEIVETALVQTPPEMWRSGLSATEVSKRLAIDAEAEFLADLDETASIRHRGAEPFFGSGPLTTGTVLGLLYIHVGSALGGLHLLRVARTAPWWRPEREHMLLRPYGARLHERWRAVLGALEQLDPDDTNDAVHAARTGFDVFQRCLVDHLEAAGLR